ncbi:TetR family transcriptional regulator [Streptomyces daqingensis]|uniref:TetR family transcriptional regulator n=1 Tax=Streptomyces daqingensis TaxID=1472640 RepID=A0ABQ2M5I3_9ACTN|nr:TetR/AcrR family transcriptional regulator [Streptomyces daqingensis]GGO47096.1 TetR family transcriptional regulator [Streptomyces daqingensis]
MTPTSSERGQETRQRLLDAAAQLIVEDGWGAVTTRRAADRAGLRPGLVHYHFRTVEDLLVEASLAAARREVGSAAELLASTGDPEEGVTQVLELMSSYSAADPSTVLFSEMLLASTRVERLRGELAELLGEWRGAVADWLASASAASGSAVPAGEPGSAVPAGEPGGASAREDHEATALLLGAALDGLVLHRLIDPSLARIPVTDQLARLAGASRRTGRR